VATCAECGYEAAGSFRFCPECGARADGWSREQRKVVTVLFCDVAGSTALGESLDAEALRALLARYFKRMKAIVERHGGVVRHRRCGPSTGARRWWRSACAGSTSTVDLERRNVLPHRDRLLAMLGRFDEANRLLAGVADRVEELGAVRYRIMLAWRRFDVAMLEGNAARAEVAAREMRETAEATADLGDYMWYCCNLARALLGLGRDDEALKWVERGREISPNEEPLPQMLWRQVRGKVLARRGELEEGERLVREAVALAEETDMLTRTRTRGSTSQRCWLLRVRMRRRSSTGRSRSTSARATSSWRSARDRDWQGRRRRAKSRSRRRTSVTICCPD
jgi:class 3 adenylate cyclase